jgi:hypothetical protein
LSTFRELKLTRAREYILANPDQSKAEQSRGCGVSPRLVAQARAQLVAEGRLAPSRKAEPPRPKPQPAPEPSEGAPAPTLYDHDAMAAMAAAADMALDNLDDEEIHRRLLRQALRFALDMKLHVDTRLSASQMYFKLRDMAKARNLGPGAPVDFETGVARLADLHRACGPKMVLAAVNLAFDVKEAPSGQAEQDAAAGGTPPAPAQA